MGGGRARAGLEIDHSEPSGSRVAISRAGRRPPAHTAARPIKAGNRRPKIRRCPEHQRDLIVEMGGIEIPSQRDARNNRQHNATTDGANRHRKNPCTA